MPSIRSLCADLGLTLPAVQRAIKQLEVEGVLESQHGVGIRILDSADCRTTPLIFGFVQPFFDPFSVSLHYYLEDALDSRSNLCVIKSTRDDPERERQQIEKLVNSGVNGLLIWPVAGDTNGDFMRETASRLPVVFVDRTIEGVQAPSVVLAYREFGRQLVRELCKAGRGRILTVCDPVNISSFNELKAGLREEAERLQGKCALTILDQPLNALIEASYQGEYDLADRCYQTLAPLLTSGCYDAVFAPQSQAYDLIFARENDPAVLGSLARVSLITSDDHPQPIHYRQLGIESWLADTSTMMVNALDLLQDMTLRRTTTARSIRVPFRRAKG